MRSKARQERRLLREQDTVGALRAERREQETLGAGMNVELVLPIKKRQEKAQERQLPLKPAARRTARPGKPLKR